ncbi:BGTF surface domain-containing protein [Halorubrum vacuolatum]|nr:BGTF surface domain-containing protein [Halorubrum vacuolatum]
MTRDNNETRKKANAVFFSVIMVVSMVAIGFAGFAGGAAAVSSNADNVDIEYDEVEDGDEIVEGTGVDQTELAESPDLSYTVSTDQEDEGDAFAGTDEVAFVIEIEDTEYVLETQEGDLDDLHNEDVTGEFTAAADAIEDLDGDDVGDYDHRIVIVDETQESSTNFEDLEELDSAVTDDTEDENEFTSETLTLSILEEPDLQVTDLDAPSEVQPDFDMTVTAEITNEGGADADADDASNDIEYNFNDDTDELSHGDDGGIEHQDLREDNIEGGESVEVEFNYADLLGEGTYFHSVTTGDDTDGLSTSVEVTSEAEEEPEEVEETGVEYAPDRPWTGQDVYAYGEPINDAGEEEYDLREVDDFDDGIVDSSSFVEELDSQQLILEGEDASDADQRIADIIEARDDEADIEHEDWVVEIDTDGLDSSDFFLRGGDLERNPVEEETFETRIMDLDTEFDDDTVSDTGGDALTDLDIDSNRGTYTLNASAGGDLDDYELFGILVDDDETFEDYGFDADTDLEEIRDDGDLEDLVDNIREVGDTSTEDEVEDAVIGVDGVEDPETFGTFNVFLYDEDEDQDDLDGDELVGLFGNQDLDEEVSFKDVDDDDYEFLFEGFDTDAEDTAEITVEDVDDAELEFVDGTVDVAQGGVAGITVGANEAADSGVLVIGEKEDFGYQMNVSIDEFNEETDEITVYFNTYAAGTTGHDVGVDDDTIVWVDEDDEDEGAEISFEDYGDVDEGTENDGGESFDTNTLDFILSDGDYDMQVLAEEDYEEAVDDPDDVGSLLIEDRDEHQVNTWTASDDTFDDIEDDVDDVFAGIEAGNVTERDLVAQEDVIIHELGSNTGLDGVFAYIERSDAEFADFVTPVTDDDFGQGDLKDSGDADNLFEFNNAEDAGDDENQRAARFRIRETRASAGPNVDRRVIGGSSEDGLSALEETDISFITSDGQSEAFVAIETEDWDDDEDSPFIGQDEEELDDEDDYEFNTNIRLEDNWLLEFDDEDDDDLSDLFQTADSTYDVEERTGEFEQDPYNATPTDGFEFNADTNIAPGTEIDMRVRSSGDTRPSFIMTDDDLEVTQDEDVTGTFNLSDTNVGDTYDLELRGGDYPDDVEAEGEIVDEVVEPAVFEVDDLDPAEATVDEGDLIDVSATVTNTGGEEDTKDVELRIDGDTVETEELELDVDEDATVEFTDVDTTGLDGTFTHSVWTEDDEAEGTLTVEVDDDEPDVDDDDDVDVDDDDDVDDVDDDTPGFGAIVALVALLAAALLATRRRP